MSEDHRPSRAEEDPAPPSWTSLWLALPSRRAAWIAVAVVALYYLSTMSRDLSFYDSAELAMVAWQGGLSHPPGHPLHTALGWLLSHLTWFRPLLGLNAASAIPAALAVLPSTSIAWLLAGGDDAPRGPRWMPTHVALPAFIVIVATHPALWEVASRVEVYALAGFLALWSLARATTLLAAQRSGRAWLGAGIGFGLAASTNPVVATAAALALVPALLTGALRRRLHHTSLLWIILGGFLGLTPYLSIPLLARREEVFTWGSPRGGEALTRYLTGADFAHNQGTPAAMILSHAVQWLGWAVDNGLLPLIGLGFIAHLLWGSAAKLGRGALVIDFCGALLFISMNQGFFVEVTDYLGYMMPPILLMGAGAAALITRISGRGERGPMLAALLAAALALSVIMAPPTIFSRTRHADRVARTLAEGALRSAPEDALIIVASDHWVFPMLYLQEVEALRPDVVLLPRGLSGASWYWAHLQRRHPDLEDFELRGPGGQPARIRRFLAANPSLSVLYEDWYQATSIGRRPGCVGPWMLHDENACPPASGGRDEDALTAAVNRAVTRLGAGAPTTGAVCANVSLSRGEMYWRLGQLNAALRALRAGAPPDRRPPLPDTLELSGPPLRGPLPRWRRPVAIGSADRNLFLAGSILGAAGLQDAALAHILEASRGGLPEAVELLRRRR